MGSDSIPQFLLKHFENIAIKEGFLNYTLEHEAGSKHGDGFVASMISVKICGERAVDGEIQADKLNLICKLLPPANIGFEFRLPFEQEVFIYNQILPLLTKFQTKLGLSESDGFFAFPKCYLATTDPDSNDMVIIMKDLRADSYSMWCKTKPIGADNVNLVMTQLGRLHGISFAIRDQEPELLKQCQSIKDIYLSVHKLKAIKIFFSNSFEKAIKTCPGEKYFIKLQELGDKWLEWISDCCEANVAEPFSVVCHGDCWNNNMMFTDVSVSLKVLTLIGF